MTKRRGNKTPTVHLLVIAILLLVLNVLVIMYTHMDERKPSSPNTRAMEGDGSTWAIAVSIMSDNSYTAFQAVGACTVFESARISRTKAQHMIALVPTASESLPQRSLHILRSCGVQVIERSFPITFEDVTDAQYRKALKDKKQAGVGIREFHKLNFWNLVNFTKIMVVDTDVLFYRNPDDAFRQHQKFIHTEGPGERMNGGFYVLEPEMAAFEQMREMILKEGAYRSDTGWYGSGRNGFADATPQGFLYWYWHVHRDQYLLIEHCFYNRMVGAPYWSLNWHKCGKLPLESTIIYHLAFCPPDISLNVTATVGAGHFQRNFQKVFLNGERHKKPFGMTLDDFHIIKLLNSRGRISPAMSDECLFALEKYVRIQARFLPLSFIAEASSTVKDRLVFIGQDLLHSGLFRSILNQVAKTHGTARVFRKNMPCPNVGDGSLQEHTVIGVDLDRISCLVANASGRGSFTLHEILRSKFPGHWLAFAIRHPLTRYANEVLGLTRLWDTSHVDISQLNLVTSNPVTESLAGAMGMETNQWGPKMHEAVSGFDLALLEERYAPSLMSLRHLLHWEMDVAHVALPLDAEDLSKHPLAKFILPNTAKDMEIFWAVAAQLDTTVKQLQLSGINTKREVHNLKVEAKNIASFCRDQVHAINGTCIRYYTSTEGLVARADEDGHLPYDP
eukprot:scaffold1222_cov317-Pavlova_lutheri.AAC.12